MRVYRIGNTQSKISALLALYLISRRTFPIVFSGDIRKLQHNLNRETRGGLDRELAPRLALELADGYILVVDHRILTISFLEVSRGFSFGKR